MNKQRAIQFTSSIAHFWWVVGVGGTRPSFGLAVQAEGDVAARVVREVFLTLVE